MRKLILAIALALPIAPAAMARDVSLPLNDAAQNLLTQLPTALDQCIAGVTLRGDPSICRSVSTVLSSLSAEVVKAQHAADEAAKAEAVKKKKK
jgi:hypothetical protein